MVIELLLIPIFLLLDFLISLIPDMTDLIPNQGIADLIAVMSLGFYIFPLSLFLIFIANILFWLALQMTWAIIEWIYKKIPGVN